MLSGMRGLPGLPGRRHPVDLLSRWHGPSTRVAPPIRRMRWVVAGAARPVRWTGHPAGPDPGVRSRETSRSGGRPASNADDVAPRTGSSARPSRSLHWSFPTAGGTSVCASTIRVAVPYLRWPGGQPSWPVRSSSHAQRHPGSPGTGAPSGDRSLDGAWNGTWSRSEGSVSWRENTPGWISVEPVLIRKQHAFPAGQCTSGPVRATGCRRTAATDRSRTMP